MNKVKKQHYLPRFYLKNFADDNGRICVVDSQLESPLIKSRIEDVAQGRYYYDFYGSEESQVAEKFLSFFENLLAPKFQSVVDSAISGKILSIDEKSTVKYFLQIQFLRSDWMRRNVPTESIKKYFKPNYVERLDRLLHAYVIINAMGINLIEYVSTYEMIVFDTKNNLEIYTSSFPLFFHTTDNIDNLVKKLQALRESESPSIDCNLFFPLSSTKALYIYDPIRGLDLQENEWISKCVTSGLAWSVNRIYFRPNELSEQLYPVLKPILSTRRFE